MIKNVFRKSLAIGIIILFVAINVSQIILSIIVEKKVTIDNIEEKYFVTVNDRVSSMLIDFINSKNLLQLFRRSMFCVPKVVQRGDLAFCDLKPWVSGLKFPGYADEHTLIYSGNNRFIEATAIFPYLYKGSNGWDIVKIGVLNTSIVFLKLWATNIIYGKVINASESQRDAAVNWTELQIRHPYQYTFKPHWPFNKHEWWACPNPNGTTYNPDTGTYFQEKYYDYWYCGELIWASYRHCNGDSGIDLGARWCYDIKDDSWHWVITPYDFLYNVDQIYLYTDGELTGKPGTNEPIVESDYTEVGITNATLHGKLIDDGDERCHCYITVIEEGHRYCGFYRSQSIDTFNCTFDSLIPGTTYQWYAWAYNSLGKIKGEIKSFTTLPLSI